MADDFIEPFRPLIDLWVATNISLKSEFTKEHRIQIIQLLHNNILLEGEKISVLNGIDRMIASFSTACIKKDYLALKIPNLIKLQE